MPPLRRRMVEDTQLRGLGAKTQASYIRAVEAFAGFPGRSPDSASPEDLRAWQLHMARTKVDVPSFNHRITLLPGFQREVQRFQAKRSLTSLPSSWKRA